MRKVLVLGALALAVVLVSRAAPAAPAGPAKVAIIDFQRTLNETKVGKAAKTKLETQKDSKQKELNAKKDALQKDAEEFKKQKVVLKPDAAAKREAELQEQFVQLQNLFMQHQQDLAKAEATATKEIVGKASSIIESIAKRDGYTVILDRAAVVYFDKASDITEEVDKRLDAGEGAK
jgi:outer membrane protein